MRISSTSNSTIKKMRGLRQRKERERSGLFFVEGIRLVTEAVQLRAPVETLVIAPELLTSALARDIVAEQAQAGIACLETTPEVFRYLSSKEGPQGIAAVVRQRWEALAQLHLQDELGWVALDAIQDPGNLGTILRTADAVGCAGVILLGHTTDPYDPVALRASMGAIFAQRLIRADFAEFATWKQQHTYPLIGTSDSAPVDYQTVSYRPPQIFLMGSERQGLPAQQQALCDTLVRIPMVGRSDSLNLAVATGVLLYEAFNQNRSRSEQ